MKNNTKANYLLTINSVAIIVILTIHKKYSEELDKMNINSQKNKNKVDQQQLIINLTAFINLLHFVYKINAICGLSLIIWRLGEVLLPDDIFTKKDNELLANIDDILKISEKLTYDDLKDIKTKLLKIGINTPKFKKKNNLWEETNIILNIINTFIEENATTNSNYWQYLKSFFGNEEQQLGSLLTNLKSWLETQNSLLSLEKEKERKLVISTLTVKENEPSKVITTKPEKNLSTHFLETLWPKWFNTILTIEDKNLLNTAFQNWKEKKFWKLLKTNKEKITTKGVKSFLEISLLTTKDDSNIARFANQEATFLPLDAAHKNNQLNLL